MTWLYVAIAALYAPIVLKKLTIGVTWKAFNPLWWILNSDHHPAGRYEGQGAIGVVRWHLRNPFHNYMKYCIGIGDRDFLMFIWGSTGEYAVPFPQSGLRLAWVCDVDMKLLCLPCLQYKGSKVECYIGWRGNGAFGMALRRAAAN